MLSADTATEMSVLDYPVRLCPWRPPTAVYPDRHQVAQSRDEDFPPTASDQEQVFKINLEGVFLSPGALVEMIVPLAQAVRNGVYGPTAVVVITSDDATAEFLEALARTHELPLFISSSSDNPLGKARPVGALTATELETISLVRGSEGAVTSSQLAKLADIEPNAAVNRVTGLVRKGYLHRVNRPRTEGDAFVDLLSIFDNTDIAAPEAPAVPSSHGQFSIPEDVREGVLLLAEMQGSEPSDVLLTAWREFLMRHSELLDTDSKEVGKMVRAGDTAGLATYASRYARERARQAAPRTKHERP